VWTTAATLVLTKLLDGWSTLRVIDHAGQESNERVRQWMLRYGIRTTVVLVVLLAIGIVAVSAWVSLVSGSTWLQATFVGLGLPISIVQAAVAYTNVTGRFNQITTLVWRLHGRGW
jgi:hypothetical protein